MVFIFISLFLYGWQFGILYVALDIAKTHRVSRVGFGPGILATILLIVGLAVR